MTTQEAIDILRDDITDCLDIGDLDEEMDADKMAIEALEKQIPKTPQYIRVYGKRLTDEAGCIECGATVYRNQSYCSECGQMIDWSEIEE